MKKIVITLLVAILPAIPLFSQETASRDSLAADFRYLVRMLEETHPDPYTAFGGRYFFHKRASGIEQELLTEDNSLRDFALRSSEFISALKDGHTWIRVPGAETSSGVLPLRARAISEGGIILDGVPAGMEYLIGGRVVSIENTPLDGVIRKLSTLKAFENVYGSYETLSQNIGNGIFLSRIFPDAGEDIRMEIRLPSGKIRPVSFRLMPSVENLPEMSYAPETVVMPGSYMDYGYVGQRDKAMLFTLRRIMARENFLFMKENGWPGLEEQLAFFYREILKAEMPADIGKAVQGVPSISETFLNMLEEMKRNGTQNLIIDLRGNTGGWTPIILPTLYMLFGDDYLLADIEPGFARFLSPLYLEKINRSLEEFNASEGREYRMGDFVFENTRAKDPADIARLRRRFINGSMSETKEAMRKQEGKPVYRPEKIYVLTDAGTFSAAFHYTYYLSGMGAEIVGVPSRQAPNTFMESTPLTLPYTGLQASISNSIQICFPAGDRRANILWPDTMIPYKVYRKYGFDRNTELLYLLDTVK